jgi:hypothetical protein
MVTDNRQSNHSDVALLVHSCDRYEFLFKGFEFFFSKYWDFTIPCHYYFATEEKQVDIRGFQNIQSGKGPWADRLALLLREKISEKYVLYFQEDMWMNKKVNPAFFTKLFQLAEEQQWKQVKLHSSETYHTEPTNYFIEGFNIAKVDRLHSDFLMSHQVTLWDKEFLLKQLLKNENPWRNERRGTRRLRKLKTDIYHIDYFAENGKPAINHNNHPTGRSEYQAISINGTLNYNVPPFIKELYSGNAEQQHYAQELENHFNNNLTHDGLPKPRKADIFKRTKNWLLGK